MKSRVVQNPVLIFVLVLAFAQLACGLGATSPGSGSGSGSGAPVAAGSVSGPCANDLWPVKAGATWTTSGQVLTGGFTRTTTITSVGANSFEAKTVDTTPSRTITSKASWQCTTAGLVEDGGPLGAVFSGGSGAATIKTLSSTGVTLPAHVQAGDSWSQVATMQFSTSQGSSTGTLTYSLKAIGMETVSVPAGSFSAMKIQVSAVSQGLALVISIDGFEWWAPGVGEVQESDNASINGHPISSLTGALQSYKLP